MHTKDAEWSKTYGFNERKKTLVLKEKFQFNGFVKMSQNIFVYFSFSEHSASSLQRKITYFGCGQGVDPPPPCLRTGP